jgi:hypothetical protein
MENTNEGEQRGAFCSIVRLVVSRNFSPRLSSSVLYLYPTILLIPNVGLRFDKYLSEELKGEVYKALILPTILYGSL